MKGGDVATCPTFHMGKGSAYQRHRPQWQTTHCKRKKLGLWVLVTGDKRRKNKKNAKEEEEGKRR